MAQRILARKFDTIYDCSTSMYLHFLSRASLLLVLTIIFLSIFSSHVLADQVTLAWDPAPTADSGCRYKVYCSTSAGGKVIVKDVGKKTSCTLDGLEEGRVYYFAATAYGAGGRESDYSNAVTHMVPVRIPKSSSDTVIAGVATEGSRLNASKAQKGVPVGSGTAAQKQQDSTGNTPHAGASAATDNGESAVSIPVVTPAQISIVMEAENGILSAPMAALPDDTASSGAYVGVCGEATDAEGSTWGSATYTVMVSQAGEYALWGLISSSGEAAPCFVSIDGGEYIIWTMAQEETSEAWIWKALNQDDSADPETLSLEPGAHTIVIYQQGEGARFDKLCIVNKADQTAAAEEIEEE